MFRNIDEALFEWKNKKNRLPLVLNGARQVGKTYSLKEFGKLHFKNMVYINLEINSNVNSFFDGDLKPDNIIQFLEIVTESRIIPEETLIVLDEIQSCPRALLSLKSFAEEAPQFHIVAAGSLLGVAINRDQFSFPVGKVDELTMYPMDFGEFLIASKRTILKNQIEHHFENLKPMVDALHNEALEAFKKYLIIGGMPAVIKEFLEFNSFLMVRDIQARILNEYVADMAKYATNATAVKIRASYDSIPSQLAKENAKFQYKVVQKGGTANIFGEAIEWLIFSGIALKCKKIDHGYIPIPAYVDVSDFKLYMGDVGLLTAKSNMPIQSIISEYSGNISFLGMIIENYVAQAFVTNGHQLFYWKNDNTAELDFILQKEGQVIPVEVKKGKHTKSKSFNMFLKKYNSEYGIRFSTKNFGYENSIKSIPLYAVWLVRK
ncbi:MAG TPA: ATP-binding protein [Saprospiraceae bacterium]|nr:ATP-binding protein [Saprospiraceae bacterium]